MEEQLARLMALTEDKAGLLRRISDERALLEQTVLGLSESELVEPAANGWSVKDHMAHLAVWQRKALSLLAGGQGHEGLAVDLETYRSTGLDGLNALILERERSRTLPDVLQDWQQTHASLLAIVLQIREEDLQQPFAPDDVGDTRRKMEGIADNTYRHDLEHRTWISNARANRASGG